LFIGEFPHSVDPKGRVIMPVKFREELGLRFVLTKGLDHCLFGFTIAEWARLSQKLQELPLASKDARAFTRFFFAGATECELDGQGRTLIPAHLREYAKLEKDIAIIGVSGHIEIWSMDLWKGYNDDPALDHDAIAERMAALGI
jgi:MraZ protein